MTKVNENSILTALQFLGERVLFLFTTGALVGIGLFVIELLFAYLLQAFLLAWGIAPENSIRLPEWVHFKSSANLLGCFILAGLLRCVFYGLQTYLQTATYEQFAFLQRGRITRWAYHGRDISSTRALLLFNSGTTSAGNFVAALQTLLLQAVTAILIVASLFRIAPRSSAIVMSCFVVMGIIMRISGQKLDEHLKSAWNAWIQATERLSMSIRNLLLLKIYRLESLEEELTYRALTHHTDRTLWAQRLAGLKYAFPQFVGVLIICLVAVLSRKTSELEAGSILSYTYLLVRFASIASTAQNSLSTLLFYRLPAEDLFQWWKQSRKLLERARPTTTPTLPAGTKLPWGWDIRGLGFSYPGATQPVLKNITLEVPPRGTVVISGPSGTGKSTLLNLILGMTEATQGTIQLIPGENPKARQPLNHLDELVSQVGYVGAEPFLIEGTIGENLNYGLVQKVSDADLREALARAHCDFVWKLDKKLDHRIGDQGQGLSAGQKQRLSLARALLRQPSVLILDEVTANLDAATEARIVQSLQALKGQITMVIVTHRMALLQLADYRVDLEPADLIE